MAVDTRQLREFQKKIQKAQQGLEPVIERVARESAKYLIDQCVMRTPVSAPVEINGDTYTPYEAGTMRTGGNLRQSWIDDNKSLIVHKIGDEYFLSVVNTNYYASYVEDGHTQHVGQLFPVYVNGKLEYRRHKKAWVEGKHFLRLSEDDLRRAMPGIVEHRISDYLKGALE